MFKSFLHGIARAFTVPAATRKTIDSNPLVQALLPSILGEGASLISAQVDKNITDPAANAAVKQAISAALQHVLG
jgi:hypothetical protein